MFDKMVFDVSLCTSHLLNLFFRIDRGNERAIINQEMSIFEQIWKSVSHGEEAVRDHLKFELGVPIGFEWGMKAMPVFKV